MAVVKPSTQRFYTLIRDEYIRLCAVEKKGAPVYSKDYVLSMLAEKFYRSPKTIENIVFNRV